MSGIFGIFNLDGRPVDRELMERMSAALAHRGPDASGIWIDGPVGLGHRMLHTTPESLHETQPLVDETGRYVLVMDGRVDNREELRRDLLAHGARLRDDTDAELILKSFGLWGEGCLIQIIGDFGLGLWDAKSRRLFLARDPLGRKPLHYVQQSDFIAFGSLIAPLITHPEFRMEPNEGMIGEYLTDCVNDLEETLLKSVRRVRPGHYGTTSGSLLVQKKFWDIDPDRRIRYSDDRDYNEHFIHLLREAVRTRLRAIGGVAIELSGGLDSSSVATVALELNRREKTSLAVQTFSYIYPGWGCDETRFIRDFEKIWGASNLLAPDEPELGSYQKFAETFLDFPGYPNASPLRLDAAVRSKGIRVVLTGLGGDEWFSGHLIHYADYLEKLQVIPLIRQTISDLKLNSRGIPLRLLRYGLLPLLRAGNMGGNAGSELAQSHLTPDFVRRTALRERMARPLEQPLFKGFVQRQMHSLLTNGTWIQSHESLERIGSMNSIERRHPFHDRRMVEFGFALPEDQRWKGRYRKVLLRNSLRELLPRSILRRTDKAGFSRLFAQLLTSRELEEFARNLEIAGCGWVDKSRVCKMLSSLCKFYVPGENRYNPGIWILWMIIGVELWFRAYKNLNRSHLMALTA